MIQPNISVSGENANIPCLRKNAKSNQSRGLKKGSKALSDVKNTLHTHSSNLIGKSKNHGKTIKKDASLSEIGELKQSYKPKTGFNILQVENDAKNKIQSGFECHNHSECEKANTLNEAEFLSEYKLTKNEINYLGDRMKFCQLNSIPVKLNVIEPLEDVEITDMKRHWCDDDIEDDLVSLEIPEPTFF